MTIGKYLMGVFVGIWSALPGGAVANPHTVELLSDIGLGEFLNIPPKPAGTFPIMGLDCFRNINPHLAHLELTDVIPAGTEFTFDTRLDHCERDTTGSQNEMVRFEGWLVSDTACISDGGATPCYFFEKGQSFTEDQLMGKDTWDAMIASIPGLAVYLDRDGRTVTFKENLIIPISF